MTDRAPTPLSCDEADALAGAWGLGALDADEAVALAAHLETCDRPHAELREVAGVEVVLAAALESIQPSAGLRERVMATIGAGPEPARQTALPARRTRPWFAPALAGLAAAAAIVLAVWNVQLNGQIAERDARLREVAAALSTGGPVVSVSGTAGGGVLVTGEDGPVFVGLVEPPGEGMLYEMWLIGPDGVPVAVGTFEPDDDEGLAVVQLERPLEGFTTFAVTRERSRVDAPTAEPVLAASI
jgi:anti-sigma-K factor RskA